MAERTLMLVLHDVAPETWPAYQPFVEAVDALGAVPITWLVVPDFHRRNALDAHPAFLKLLESRLARGDELVLHGCYHADDAPAPRSLSGWLSRRVYTHEGEFAALDEAQARERLALGMRLFERHGWPLHGFVAPAWLLGDGARRALAGSGLRYTSDRGHFYLLPAFRSLAAPSLVWSAGSRWRRGLSWLFSEQQRRRHRQGPLLRLGVHPVDMRHPFSRSYWLHLLQQLLDEGWTPATKIAWLRQHGPLDRAS